MSDAATSACPSGARVEARARHNASERRWRASTSANLTKRPIACQLSGDKEDRSGRRRKARRSRAAGGRRIGATRSRIGVTPARPARRARRRGRAARSPPNRKSYCALIHACFLSAAISPSSLAPDRRAVRARSDATRAGVASPAPPGGAPRTMREKMPRHRRIALPSSSG